MKVKKIRLFCINDKWYNEVLGGASMEIMNRPVECKVDEADIIMEYEKCHDKNKVARIFLIPVKEVTEVLNRTVL